MARLAQEAEEKAAKEEERRRRIEAGEEVSDEEQEQPGTINHSTTDNTIYIESSCIILYKGMRIPFY